MLNSDNNAPVLGWDVGGAHLKAAVLDQAGKVLKVIQMPCALWQGLDVLTAAVSSVLQQLEPEVIPKHHFITMTGELADIFPDRNEGVKQIAHSMCKQLKGNVAFYAGNAGFVAIKSITTENASLIASANWLASATLVAKELGSGLLVDIGSTTSDLVLLVNGFHAVRGYTDAERMQFDELVYTGVIRTPLMAMAQQMPFGGEWLGLAAEHFATTADVYRLTGDLAPCSDMASTADGAGKSLENSARRLARMIGHDMQDAPMSAWLELAQAFKQAQLSLLKRAVLRCLSRNLIKPDAPLIGAGAGSFLVKELALQLHRPYLDVATFIKGNQQHVMQWAGICLPAYAVANLALNALSSDYVTPNVVTPDGVNTDTLALNTSVLNASGLNSSALNALATTQAVVGKPISHA